MLQSSYDELVELLESAREDVGKAETGNKSAGTRVRKVLGEVKKKAHAMRKAVLEARENPAPPKPNDPAPGVEYRNESDES